MSRWLKGVNSLLDKLDDRAENVAEERAIAMEEHEGGPVHGADINDILARRGLAAESLDEENSDRRRGLAQSDEGKPAFHQSGAFVTSSETSTGVQETDDEKTAPDGEVIEKSLETVVDSEVGISDPKEPDETEEVGSTQENRTTDKQMWEKKNTPIQKPDKQMSTANAAFDKRTPPPPPLQPTVSKSSTKVPGTSPSPEPTKMPIKPPNNTTKKTQKEKDLAAEAKEAKKEARTLRRHVVSLNSQLEAAELELRAQRQELEQAAQRIEKDRAALKEEKGAILNRHTQEVTALKLQNEQTAKEEKSIFEEQLQGYKNMLAEAEGRRKQEGGDRSKEIAQASEREQEVSKRLEWLENEKVILLSQISTLQGQQAALGSRLESLTQATDNAMAREREAEDRLDVALSQHVRQISQRQAREGELERTIQDLNAALVARNGQTNSSRSELDDADATPPVNDRSWRARIGNLENDLQAASAHLVLERERSEALLQQLREMSKESTLEASTIRVKQLNYDRQIADLNLTISRLQSSLREAQKEPPHGTTSAEIFTADNNEMKSRIKLLSEEVLRLRDKVANYGSESLAMKNRLHEALDRAAKAEEEVATVSAENGNNVYDFMERASSGNGSGRRRRPGGPPSGSMRSAMRLNSGQGERSEQIGDVVDAVDSFAVTTGKYLRRNPLARAGFIFYLLLIHLWTFVLLFFHAHSFEAEHGDFGAGIGMPPGLHPLVRQEPIKRETEAVDILPGVVQAASPK